jgi:hypothetical protein
MDDQNVHNEQIVHDQNIEQAPQVDEYVPEPIEQQQVQDNRERNFAALREARERAERERDEAIYYARQLQMQAQQNNQQPIEDHNLAPDDLVEWRHVENKIKNIESKLRQYENYTQTNVADARIKAQFNDFDQVVTHETVERLRTMYPEIAQSLHATPDIYNKAVSTYNIIKKFGLANGNYEHDKYVAQRNSAKPKPTNTVAPQQGDSPLNKANDFSNGFLTQERKNQLYKDMMDAKNNY